jgi:hypothetical protein
VEDDWGVQKLEVLLIGMKEVQHESIERLSVAFRETRAMSNARCRRVTLTAQIRCRGAWSQAVNAQSQVLLNVASPSRRHLRLCGYS